VRTAADRTGGPARACEGACVDTPTSLCLQDGRFERTIGWSTAAGEVGSGRVVPSAQATDSGLFYFFDSGNWEVLAKVLDGCAVNGHHWVFLASATDVGLDVTVRDVEAGAMRHYRKDAGRPAAAVTDVGAFPDSCKP